MPTILACLKKVFRKNPVVVCIGNVLRGDDGFGPEVARLLKGFKEMRLFDAGPAPENVLGLIMRENPSAILFVDGVDGGLAPGTIVFSLVRERLAVHPVTHGLPLATLVHIAKRELEELEAYLIGAQVKQLSFGVGLSPEVTLAAKATAELLRLSLRKSLRNQRLV